MGGGGPKAQSIIIFNSIKCFNAFVCHKQLYVGEQQKLSVVANDMHKLLISRREIYLKCLIIYCALLGRPIVVLGLEWNMKDAN